MKKRENWDIEKFNRINLPEVVGLIQDPKGFSKNNGIRVLDMPVKMVGTNLRFPKNIKKTYQDIVRQAIEKEVMDHGSIDDFYVYITIDQKMVKKGKTGRRAGAHSDGYIERENKQIDITENAYDIVSTEKGEVSHTYIVHSNTPTEFFNAKFPILDSSCEGSMKTFDSIAQESEIISYNNFTLLKMTPFVVHRCGIVKEDGPRTFMKISISRKKYAREGNTKNELFHYNWNYKERSLTNRNHPW